MKIQEPVSSIRFEKGMFVIFFHRAAFSLRPLLHHPRPVVHPLDVFKLLFIIGHILLTLREPEMLLDSISSCIGPVLFQRNECKGQYFKVREAGWKRDRKYTRKYGVLGRNSPLCGQSYWHLQDRLWDFLEDAFSLRHLCLLSWVFYKVPRRSSEV